MMTLLAGLASACRRRWSGSPGLRICCRSGLSQAGLAGSRDQPALSVTYDAVKSEYGQHRIEAPGVALAMKPGMCRLADGSTLTGWRATLALDGGEVRDGCAWER